MEIDRIFIILQSESYPQELNEATPYSIVLIFGLTPLSFQGAHISHIRLEKLKAVIVCHI